MISGKPVARLPAVRSPFVYGVLTALFGVSALLLATERMSQLARFFGTIASGAVPNWDFQVYYALGHLARTDPGQLYDTGAQVAEVARLTGDVPESSLGFAYPPFFALAMSPLSRLDADDAYRLFLWANVVLIVVFVGLLWRLASPAPPWQRVWLALLVVTSDATFHVLAPGQISAFLVLAMAGGLLLLRQKRDLAAGGVLAIVAVKPHLLIGIVLLLALRARWRAIASLGATVGAFVVATLPVMGPGVYLDHARALLGQAGGGGLDATNYERMHSWRGFLASTGLDGSTAVYVLVGLLVAGAGLGLALWAWRRGPAQGDGTAGQEWAVALLLPLVLTPHLWTQDLLVFGLVAALLLSQFASAGDGIAGALRSSAIVLAGYVALAESYRLAQGGNSITIIPLFAAFVWLCLASWRQQAAAPARRTPAREEALAA